MPNAALLPAPTAFDEPNPPGHYYPYSVCDGGARTPAEFLAKLDSLGRAHLQSLGFDFSQLRIVYAETDLDRQVSARFANRIVRTRKILHIQKGERLFTDGVHYARARCCNAIFEPSAKAPVPFASTVEEKAMIPALDVPFLLVPPEALFTSPGAGEDASIPESSATASRGARREGPGQGSNFAPGAFPTGGAGLAGAGPGVLPVTRKTIPSPPPVPAATPEPGTLSLLSLAFVSGLLSCRIGRFSARLQEKTKCRVG